MNVAQAIFVLLLLSPILAPLYFVATALPAALRARRWGQLAGLAACLLIWCVQWPVYYATVLVCLSGHCREESALPGLALVACNGLPLAWLLWQRRLGRAGGQG